MMNFSQIKAANIKPVGLKILMDSNFPKDVELGWGSAITTCSIMVTAQANGVLDKLD